VAWLKKSLAPSLLCVFLTASLTFPIQQAKANSIVVSTLSGTGGAGLFNTPSGVSVSPDGSIYVADQKNFQLKKIVGEDVSIFFTAPNAVALDTGNSYCSVFVKSANEIFASDCLNSRVYKFSKNGQLLQSYTMGLSLPNRFYDWGGGLAVDLNGGIFLSDEYNRLILRIDEVTGATSIYSGIQGKSGLADGDSSSALFFIPRGLAVDSKGNLLVADAGNDRIRKITPQRITSTYSDRVPAVIGVAVDSQDTIYAVSERWPGAIISKIGSGRIFDDSTISITSSVSGGITGQLAFSGHSGLSIDRFGSNPTNNIYLTDQVNHAVKVYSKDGKFVKRWGSQDGYGVTNVGTTNQIYDYPSHVFPLDDESYLVTDNFTIRHINSSGEVLKTTRLTQGCYFSPGITITPDGTLFCVTGSKVMARFPDGTWTTIGKDAGGRKDGRSGVAEFDVPEGLATYKGDVYVADRANRQIRKITRIPGTKDFEVSTVLGTGLPTSPTDIQPRDKATFSWPAQITIDGLGNLFIADGGVDSIWKTSLTQQGDVTRIASGLGSWPTSMTVDRENTVYVSTEKAGLFQVKNNAMTYLGGKGFGNKEGAIANSSFNTPRALSINLKGELIVADQSNQKFKKISLSGPPGLNIYSSRALINYMFSAQDAEAEKQMGRDRQAAIVKNTFYTHSSVCHPLNINAELQVLVQGSWQLLVQAKGWDYINDCPWTHPMRPWTIAEPAPGAQLRWRVWSPGQFDNTYAQFPALLTTAAKAAADKAAADKAAADKAAADKAAADKAIEVAKAAAEAAAKIAQDKAVEVAKAAAEAAAKIAQDKAVEVAKAAAEAAAKIAQDKAVAVAKAAAEAAAKIAQDKAAEVAAKIAQDKAAADAKAAAVAKAAADAKAAAVAKKSTIKKTSPPKVTCFKGAQKKEFTATKCPPGWLKK